MKTRRNVLVAALVLVTIAVASAGLLADEPKIFSHKQHIEEGAEECSMCHKAEEGRTLPVLSREGCEECHDDGPPSPWKLPVPTRRLGIAFPHAVHAEAQECKACHAKTTEESQPAGEALAGQADCSSCHAQNDVEVAEGQCAACHGEDRRKVAPADHAHAWRLRHGKESQWRAFGQHGQDCSLCHRGDGCRTCHKTERPRSHTALWRNRAHGIEAGWDREACKTCHNAGTCIRCHRTNAPLNHKGAWRATHGLAAQSKTNQHCTVCHSQAWCAACHAGGRP